MRTEWNKSYGEDQEPYWRTHDSSVYHSAEGEIPRPPLKCCIGPEGADPDWDDSRWLMGESYWLGHRYHQSGPWRSVKNFFGVGPRNYQRPDWRVHEEVCQALTHEPDVDASDIVVSVSDGHVTLTGNVHDRWMKRQAEEAIYFLPGVRDVKNLLEPGRWPQNSNGRSAR